MKKFRNKFEKSQQQLKFEKNSFNLCFFFQNILWFSFFIFS